MISESDAVRDMMNSISTIRFTVAEPKETRLRLEQQAAWLVLSMDRKEPRNIGPLKAIWKDREGAIWLETVEIDDMMSLVEREYGEKGVHRFPYVERGVAPRGDLPDEVAKFPRVVTMLKECEERVAEISERTGVRLKIIYDGGTGVATFRIGAKIADAPTDMSILRQVILPIAQVLREAHNVVVKVVWARYENLWVDIS